MKKGEPEPEILNERRWEKMETYGQGYSPRTGHTVVSHDASLYVFGGTDRRRRQHDLFQYDIEARCWNCVQAGGPLPPRRSGALGVVHGAHFYIFGGYDGRDGNYFNDLFYFNFESRCWVELARPMGERPQPRTDHIMVLHDTAIYVFGGYDGHTRYDNMFAFDLESQRWSTLNTIGDLPSRRFGHSGTVHTPSAQLIVFGGWDGKDTLNDVHAYHFPTRVWRKIITTGASPPHRYRHTSVIFQDALFVFGGVDKQHCRYNDLQRLCLKTFTWTSVATNGFVPSSRTFHRAVSVGNLMYLLGGYDGTDRLHDLYSIHVGPLSPPTLLNTTAAYLRHHYQHVAAITPTSFDGVSVDLMEWLVWRRDEKHQLRGGCKNCPCQTYERYSVTPLAGNGQRGNGLRGKSSASSAWEVSSLGMSSSLSRARRVLSDKRPEVCVSPPRPQPPLTSMLSMDLSTSPPSSTPVSVVASSPMDQNRRNFLCGLFRNSHHSPAPSGLLSSNGSSTARSPPLIMPTLALGSSSLASVDMVFPMEHACICGHGNTDHEHIDDRTIYSSQMAAKMMAQHDTAIDNVNWYGGWGAPRQSRH